MSKKYKYPSTELSTEQRELIARLVGPLEVRGISRSVFRDVLADAGITVPKSSLDRWVRAHTAMGRIFTTEKASGAVPLLDNEQCEIAAGWVLSQNDSNQTVSLASFSKFCESTFGVKLAQTTAHDYLHALGLSSKVSQLKTSGFTVDVDVLTKMMFEWKRERQRTGDLKGLLASIDFTFTGHRTDRRVTYAPAGGAQPKSGAAIAQFTNCIVIAIVDRMEESGMRWVMDGAKAMLGLRCIYINGDWEQFMNFNIDQEQQVIHPATAKTLEAANDDALQRLKVV